MPYSLRLSCKYEDLKLHCWLVKQITLKHKALKGNSSASLFFIFAVGN